MVALAFVTVARLPLAPSGVCGASTSLDCLLAQRSVGIEDLSTRQFVEALPGDRLHFHGVLSSGELGEVGRAEIVGILVEETRNYLTVVPLPAVILAVL